MWTLGTCRQLVILLLVMFGLALGAPQLRPLTVRASTSPIQQISSDQQQLASVEAQIASLQGQIANDSAAQSRLGGAISSLNADITSVQNQLAGDQLQLQQLEAQEAAASARLVATQANLASEQQSFDANVRSMAKQQKVNYLTLILTSATFSNFLARLMDIQQVLAFNMQLVNQLRQERAQVSAERLQLDQERQNQQNLVDAVAGTKVMLAEELSTENAALVQLSAAIMRASASSAVLRATSAGLRAQISADQGGGGSAGSTVSVKVPPSYLMPIFAQAAARFGVPEALLLAVADEESGFNPLARSPDGAEGIMQMMPSTFEAWAPAAGFSPGADPFNPSVEIPVATAMLGADGAASGNIAAALYSYNHSAVYVAVVEALEQQYQAWLG